MAAPTRQSTRALACGLALLALLPLAEVAGAQRPGVLTGIVRDAAGAPIALAEVAVVTSDRRAITDSSGAFTIGSLRAGAIVVTVRRLGYQPGEIFAEIPAGATTRVEIVLRPSAATLDTVRVFADFCTPFADRGFDCRRSRRLPGTFLDARAMDSIGAQRIPELFKGIPGFKVVPIKPSLGGPVLAVRSTVAWRCLVEMVDSRPPDPLLNPMPLTPEELYAVEIYATPREVPRELQRYMWKSIRGVRTPCPVVMYWTSGAKRKRT